MRPSCTAWHATIAPCVTNGSGRSALVCESGDWLGRDRELAVEPGDLVAVLSAGAYAMSMASNYNTRGRAAEVLVAGSDAWLIRDREPAHELFRGEHLL